MARRLQRETIEKFIARERWGTLRYFGLPSTGLFDVSEWRDLFAEFVAVERGEPDSAWEMQHELELQAYRIGISGKIKLLRGDIDTIILKGRDAHKNKLRYPYDVVSLDYSGGLFYKDSGGEFVRLKAVSRVISEELSKHADFVLLISCNLDAVDQGEVRRSIGDIRTQLERYGVKADEVIDAYLQHADDEVRLKIYVPYFVNQEAAKNHSNCETQKVIVYDGNLGTRMMAFRFYLTFDVRTQSMSPPRTRLNQLINQPFIEISEGQSTERSFGLPKVSATDIGGGGR